MPVLLAGIIELTTSVFKITCSRSCRSHVGGSSHTARDSARNPQGGLGFTNKVKINVGAFASSPTLRTSCSWSSGRRVGQMRLITGITHFGGIDNNRFVNLTFVDPNMRAMFALVQVPFIGIDPSRLAKLTFVGTLPPFVGLDTGRFAKLTFVGTVLHPVSACSCSCSLRPRRTGGGLCRVLRRSWLLARGEDRTLHRRLQRILWGNRFRAVAWARRSASWRVWKDSLEA